MELLRILTSPVKITVIAQKLLFFILWPLLSLPNMETAAFVGTLLKRKEIHLCSKVFFPPPEALSDRYTQDRVEYNEGSAGREQ